MRDSDEQNPQLGAEIRTVVERQLRSSELEAPNQALERLTACHRMVHMAVYAFGVSGTMNVERILTTTVRSESNRSR
jgi:hypothetical protein